MPLRNMHGASNYWQQLPAGKNKGANVSIEHSLLPQEDAAEKVRKNLFVRVVLNKPSYYANELVIATYKLYSRVADQSKINKVPAANDFVQFDMPVDDEPVTSVEYVKPYYYTVRVIKKLQLVPLTTGKLVLDPLTIDATVRFVQSVAGSGGNSLDALVDQIQAEERAPAINKQVNIRSDQVVVDVRQLPASDKPEGFAGIVGQFTLESKIGSDTVQEHDINQLRLTIRGAGYLPAMDTPSIAWPAGISLLSVKVEEQIDRDSFYRQASRTFIYSFAANAAGAYRIPLPTIGYFDPARMAYSQLQSGDDIALTVDRSGAASSIHQQAAVGSGAGTPVQSLAIWMITGSLSLLGIGGWWIVWRKRKSRTRETKTSGRSPTLAIDILEQARQWHEKEDHRACISEINRTLLGTVAQRFDLPFTELSKANINKVLLAQGYTPLVVEELVEVLAICEENLFMPELTLKETGMLLKKATRVMNELHS
jgi:hypothetical protein